MAGIIVLTKVEVTRVNRSGHGVQVTDSRESGGRTYKMKYTVWFTQEHGLREGDVVSLSGELGAKVGDPWEDRATGEQRRSVELSVNFPKLDGEASRAPARDGFENDGAEQFGPDTPF